MKQDYSEYVVRPSSPGYYEVAKFTGAPWPEIIYRAVSADSCTCAGSIHGHCRHMEIVKEYIRMGAPHMNLFWLDANGEVNGFVLNFTPLRREYEKVTRNSGFRISDAQRLRELRESPRKAPLRDPIRRRVTRAKRSRRPVE